jgi:hypothetical protein
MTAKRKSPLFSCPAKRGRWIGAISAETEGALGAKAH